ncbi:MAG: hypothetical protein JRG82_01155 [Deltaproteobacteria bacterium]|nr:hypothetical protein [Deltaproteobacteria bacterium]
MVALLAPAVSARGAGTPAGDTVTNQASLTFEAGGAPGSSTSNVHVITVDELIAVSTTLQTIGNVLVAPGATGELLTFRVENTGNGVEDFTLAVSNAAAGDDFDPSLNTVYVDTDPDGAGPAVPDGVFNVADDLPYNAASPPTLDANTAGQEAITVFLFNDIPGPGPPPTDDDLGDSELTAESVTVAGLAPGAALAGAGDGGGDAVTGPGGPSSAATGTYQVVTSLVSVSKSGTVLGPAAPGTQIEYSLDVSATGSGTATAVMIRDAIPVGTTYVAGSIELDSVPLSDVPGDGADFNVSNPGAITVDLGDMTSVTPNRTITFRVTIN